MVASLTACIQERFRSRQTSSSDSSPEDERPRAVINRKRPWGGEAEWGTDGALSGRSRGVQRVVHAPGHWRTTGNYWKTLIWPLSCFHFLNFSRRRFFIGKFFLAWGYVFRAMIGFVNILIIQNRFLARLHNLLAHFIVLATTFILIFGRHFSR